MIKRHNLKTLLGREAIDKTNKKGASQLYPTTDILEFKAKLDSKGQREMLEQYM